MIRSLHLINVNYASVKYLTEANDTTEGDVFRWLVVICQITPDMSVLIFPQMLRLR